MAVESTRNLNNASGSAATIKERQSRNDKSCVKLSGISKPYVMSKLRDRIIGFARKNGVNGDDLTDLQIALGEALGNAYKHGSPVKGESRIYVDCEAKDHVFIIDVMDEGSPFDHTIIAEPRLEEMPDCGLGVYLMKQVMNTVEFTHYESGNRVRLIKQLCNSR